MLTFARSPAVITARRPFVVPAFAVLAILAALAGSAPAQAKSRKPDLSKAPVLKTIPPELLAAFPVLAQKRATHVPNYVLRSFAEGALAKKYRPEPRQTRAIGGMK